MPLLRCADEECEHEWFERSQSAVGSDWPICESPTYAVGVDDDPPAELNAVSNRLRTERAHPLARAKAARGAARAPHWQPTSGLVMLCPAEFSGVGLVVWNILGSLRSGHRVRPPTLPHVK